MPKNLRIATFNCENLFTRPKIFRSSRKKSLELLDYVKLLQDELTKEVFDHDRIKELKQKLSGYAFVRDVRGKHTSSRGAKEWLGWVELSRKKADDVAVKNIARVISEINPDIICLIEVEDRPLLQRFHDDLLYKIFLEKEKSDRYEFVLLIDGNDRRGIDVSVMSRLPIQWVRSHVHERILYNNKLIPTFSRDCLEVQIEIPNENALYLLVNHFKSMGYSPGNDPQSNRRREGQSKRVAELVDAYDLEKDNVIVAGDLNADSDNPSLFPLLNKEGLYNVNLELPPTERGTYKTTKAQLDYIIISKALKTRLSKVSIDRRGIYSKTQPHFDTVKGKLTEASDHAAVVADFSF